MRAINSSVMKQANRKMVLDQIRRQPISRAEISDCTLLTRASVTQIVDELMEEGIVTETSVVGRNRLGRRLTQLALVRDARYMIGVNFSRPKYDFGIINLGGDVLYQATGAILSRPVEAVVSEICENLRCAIASLELEQARICGMGICAPGPLDTATGVILNPPNFSIWHNVPIVRLMRQRSGIEPILLENISNAHALDERYFGVARGVENFMLLRVDEGVGAGLILRDRLFTGPNGHSPEIGHVSIHMNGPLCDCGNRGCLERYISFPAVLQGTRFQSWQQVMDADADDSEAAGVLDRVTEALGFVFVNTINIFDLEKIVISGMFTYRGDRLAERLNRALAGKTLRDPGPNPVLAGEKIEVIRIAAMPAYHRLFSD